MKLKKSLFILALVSLLGIAPSFAQDNVLEQARQKYDRTRSDTTDQSRAEDLTRANADAPAESDVTGAAPAAPAATPANDDVTVTADKTETVTTEDKTITIDVHVTVKPKKTAKPAARDADADAGTEDSDRRFFVFQLVPGIPAINPRDEVYFAVSPLVCDIGTIKALQIGLFLAKADQVSGVQLSSIGSITGTLEGVQSSSIFNISGHTAGFQHSGVFNIADDLSGVQAAGVFNTAATTTGLQASGVFNTADNLTGVQAAGVFNIADNVNGLQSAGVFNIAGDVNGVQTAGVFNVAKKVKGVQLGVVNISDDMEGVAIGLINITKNGIHEINAWYESNNMLNFAIMNGDRHFYTVLQGGALVNDYFQNSKSLTGGLGMGVRLGSNDGLYFQTDLSVRTLIDLNGSSVNQLSNAPQLEADGWRHVNPDVRYNVSLRNPFAAAFPSLRAAIGLNLFDHLGIFGGALVDFEAINVWNLPAQYQSPAYATMNFSGQVVNAFAKLYAGVSLH